ncbi:MAG: hypothetical protein JSV55_04945, partial [Deltaproteobacteria bacterium]
LFSRIEPASVTITHPYGQKRAINSPQFHYPDTARYHENHFEVVIGTRYKRSYWVHFAKIAKAYFHKRADMTEIFIVTDQGRLLMGLFPQQSMTISGRGESGPVSYPIAKVRSIEFTTFISTAGGSHMVLDRASASALLEKEWDELRVSAKTWIVTDGGISYENARLINIVDCFFTDRIGYIVHSDRMFRRCHGFEFHGTLAVKMEGATADLVIDELDSIQFTGKKVDDGLELIAVRSADSSSLTGIYPINLDEDDTLVWKTALGHKGISLLPLRQITIRARDDE